MEDTFKEDECPMCKTELYLKPSMKLQKADCGHRVCETCIKRSLSSRISFQCPVCRLTLRKESFQPKSEEDPELDREVSMRHTILRDFNKRRDDFPTLKEYNDYLEEVEDLIFDLLRGSEEAEEKVKKNKKENCDLISRNKAIQAEEERSIESQLIQDKQEFEEKHKNYAFQERFKLQQQMNEKEEQLDDMASGMKRTGKIPLIYIPQQPQLQNVLPQPKTIVTQPSTTTEPNSKQTLKQLTAGGWKESYPRLRSIEEAFSSLLF